ncbi:MAG TPA: twin-arginine translocase TatA/TatE family subunit, partial [Actinomycetota bacterium]|nr:twin-arginine translocase TatA/TatE family subunit [Actinomycetota bacterium]
MGSIGAQEILLILVIALVVVGPRRLPELARSIGKGLREIRRAQDEVRKTVEVSLDADEPRPSPPPRATAGPPNARPTPPRAEDEEAATPPGETSAMAEVSRTLGRGLAELRRAREEVQRSFQVDLGGARSPVGS